MKKKIYLVQANYLYGRSAHIPYAVGTLSAFAQSDTDINESYSFEKIFFLREKTDKVVAEMDSPFLVGLSCYVWNYEYNKLLAKKIKAAYPTCLIVMGGHHIADGSKQLDECHEADYLIHGEGELVFRDLLLSLVGKKALSEIPNLSYRNGGTLVDSEVRAYCADNYPSPYLCGCFDSLVKENPELEFLALLETARGCPYSCTYCDWGNLATKIRFFSFERLASELEWLAKMKIGGIGSPDANFGIVERDLRVAEMLVEAKKKTGYPQVYQTSYAKNSNERVFQIGKLFNDSGMNKGVTVSFQTMSPEVAKNIGRKNIEFERFEELMRMYNESGIATYTELILGLPGETCDSFLAGIDKLLTMGQHHAIYIHNCEWLPCSEMGHREYIERFGIKTTKIPLNQPHRESSSDDEAPEFSQIVTETISMSSDDWVKMNLISAAVQCFHSMGLLRFPAIFLHFEKGLSYAEFYASLLEHLLSSPDTLAGDTFIKIRAMLIEALLNGGKLTCKDSRLCPYELPFEEFAFLSIAFEAERFYNEIKHFLSGFCCGEALDELIKYQHNMLKLPAKPLNVFDIAYNFPDYFEKAVTGLKPLLEKKPMTLTAEYKNCRETMYDYARYTVWYGRKDGSLLRETKCK